MINEVRRKPEKPRLYRRNGIWFCVGKDLMVTEATGYDAYDLWKRCRVPSSKLALTKFTSYT